MDTQFSVFEVLQIAEEVEAKAGQYHLRAAERFADEERRGIHYRLAEWRAKHQDTWRRIRRRYSERTGESGVFDPDNYVLSNPQTMAGLMGVGTDPNGRGWPTGYETNAQILRDAVRRSQGIVIFYLGLKEFARGQDVRLVIDDLVSEENRHIRLLNLALERMPAFAEEEQPMPVNEDGLARAGAPGEAS